MFKIPVVQRLIGSPRLAGYVQLHQAVPLVERQHVIIEALREHAPDPLPGRVLAEKARVSVRTIERDIDRLCEAGVPIRRHRGRFGGFGLDAVHDPTPVPLTASEIATIIASLVALATYTTSSAETALSKLTDHLTGHA